MISVFIDDVLTDVVEAVAERNRKEVADYGKITVVSTRAERYEPYSVVKLGEVGDYEQYVVQSDEPLLLKDDLYEHQINLGECMLKLETVFPVDRAFTLKNGEPYTIREILDIYKRELEEYQDFLFDYTDDDLFNTQVPNKEYSGSLAEIVYDLFRSINAIPRATYDSATDTWTITHELYTKRGSALTLSTEGEQSTVNDIDYATEVLAKSRNAVDESSYIWYPSKAGWVTPRNEGTMFQTSALRYELDSPIMAIDKVYVRKELKVNTYIDYEGAVGSERYYLQAGASIDIDITRNVLETERFNSLKSIGDDFFNEWLGDGTPERVKENCVSYDAQGRYIENLYSQITGFLGFPNNIYHLRSATNQYAVYSALENEWDNLIDNYLLNDDGSPASSETKAIFKALTFAERLEIITLRNLRNRFYIDENTENIEARFKYRPRRDIDFVAEKYTAGTLNKTTILNNQRDSFVDIGRYIENNNALANRIGNVIKNVTQSFNTWAERWQLGDYVGEWLIIDVRWQIDTNNIVCIADMAKGFSNTDREYAVSRQPSAYAFTGKAVQSNFIYRQYIEAYQGDDKVDSSLLTADGEKVALNILDYDSAYNKPLTNANILASSRRIDAPVVGVGSGNMILLHFAFDDPRIAGNGMIFTGDAGRGTYAWYKDPVYYVNEDDFSLFTMSFTLENEVDYLDDTASRKYYPRVRNGSGDYWQNKTYRLDKDINASLAFTSQLVVYSEDEDIVIGNAFTKYNNLIKEFETAPTLTLYEGLSAYTVFDKYVRATDTVVSGGQVNLTGQTLTVLDSLDEAIEFWCLAYGDEIVIAGNNSVSEIKFNFKLTRFERDLDFYFKDANFSNLTSFSVAWSKWIEVERASFSNSTSFTADYVIKRIINRNVEFDNRTLFNSMYRMTQRVLATTLDTNYDYTFTDSTPSNVTIEEIETQLSVTLFEGDIIRVTDGTLPATYDYYIVELEEI